MGKTTEYLQINTLPKNQSGNAENKILQKAFTFG